MSNPKWGALLLTAAVLQQANVLVNQQKLDEIEKLLLEVKETV